jgi:hypothetical protein
MPHSEHRLNHLEYLDALASLGYNVKNIVAGQTPGEPTTTTAMPTKPEDMQKDPVFQSVFSDLAAGKLALPGNPKLGTPEFTAGLFAEYSKRKAAAAQRPPGQVPVQLALPPAPEMQRASKTRRWRSALGAPQEGA